MRRLIVVLPHLLTKLPEDSILRSGLPALSKLAEGSEMLRLSPVAAGGVPEASFLGLDPSTVRLQPGPLAVAAFGADPPPRSVHFCLNIMNLDDNSTLSSPGYAVKPSEIRQIIDAARRLDTKSLTLVEGEGLDHALVWENGSIEMKTVEPEQAIGSPLKAVLPEGEKDTVIRRYIDDSVNLLTDLEVNRRRADEELPLLNLLWPWGQGFRTDLPNLAIRRGEICHVESRSQRLAGLCRLIGYPHGERVQIVKADNCLKTVGERLANQLLSVLVLDHFSFSHRPERREKADWFMHQIDSLLLAPLLEFGKESPLKLTILAPGGQLSNHPKPEGASEMGLGMIYDNRVKGDNRFPFDERVIDDPRLPVIRVWEGVVKGLEIA